jgi:hypothetical protein
LHLSQELGVDVSHLRPRGRSAEEQIAATADSLALCDPLRAVARLQGVPGATPDGGRTKAAPRSFLLALSMPMGKKGGRKEGSFVTETRRQATDFYRDLV